jgi:hypothetical protein
LLLQPSQLPFERFDLLHAPADPDHQLRDDLFGGQRSLFPLLLALDRAGMLGPIIMSRLPITPLLQWGRSVARRSYVLADADHRPDPSRGGAACPAQNVGIGVFAESLPFLWRINLWKSLKCRQL